MDNSTAYIIAGYLGTALVYAFPAFLIIISRLISRLISRKVVKNTSIWVYGIIFSIMMLLFFEYDPEYFSLGAFLVTLFLYLFFFYIDYLFYSFSKKPKG